MYVGVVCQLSPDCGRVHSLIKERYFCTSGVAVQFMFTTAQSRHIFVFYSCVSLLILLNFFDFHFVIYICN